MTGADLYQIFCDAMRIRGTTMDEWGDLSEDDQYAWNYLADQFHFYNTIDKVIKS